MTRILVIKLGALGDVVLATGPFSAIRRHHPDARITLLTTAPFAEWLGSSPWFDEIWTDPRLPLWHLGSWLALRRRLRAAGFARVYDLQTSSRTSRYFTLMGPGRRPEWSGIAPGASHPDADPERDRMHTAERQRGQLAAAGIAEVPAADLSWSSGPIERFGLMERFALLVPGGAAHRPEKRWPAERYEELGARILERGISPVFLGAAAEKPLTAALAASLPGARDLAGETSLADLASLGRSAQFAVGNDTGPMHVLAAAGCRSLVLFGQASDPALCAPRGDVTVIRAGRLEDLDVDRVEEAL